jgi:hypothetical protein
MVMGLWMKCPKCQTHNPLSLKACESCGSLLDNLPQEQRVYVLTPPGAAKPARLLKATPTAESPLPAAAPEAQAASPKAKAQKKARKKKS